MSDTSGSYSSEKSIEINDEKVVEVKEAGVQACADAMSRSLSEESEHAFGLQGGDYIGYPRVPWEEKLLQARSFKLEGNEKFKSGSYKTAIGKYHRALLYLKGIKDAQQGSPLMPVMENEDHSMQLPPAALSEIKQLQVDCYNNLSGTLHVFFLKII